MSTSAAPAAPADTTRTLTRRALLERTAALSVAGAVGPALIGCGGGDSSSRGGGDPPVAIVGAGLAGLTCAHRLRQAGVASVIFEANPERIGGRCWTSRGWADDQIAEHGGEFIDSRHRRMRALVAELGLELDDLYARPIPGSGRVWLHGRLRELEGLAPERDEMTRRLRREAARIGPYDHVRAGPAARAMDEMSAREWLDLNVAGGSGSAFGRLVWSRLAGDFGLDASRLSAINLITFYVDYPSGADSRYVVRGGNDQIVAGLASRLPEGTIEMGARLERLRRDRAGRYELAVAGDAAERRFERVVLALPFTMLRRVELDGADLSRRKRDCIEQLGMGTNAKLLLQTRRRPQAYRRWNSYLVHDDPYYLTWESSLAEPGRAGLLTLYFGGRSGGADLSAPEPHCPAPAQLAARMLDSLQRADLAPIASESIRPGWVDHWAADPFVGGAYAAFLPGQYTRWYGYAGRPEGGITFAGEHTATVNQGYLEGAVESGERAAREVLAGARR